MENEINEAWQACLSGPQGERVIQWLVEQFVGNQPLTVVGASGADRDYALFRDGGNQVYLDILSRAGYKPTFERKLDDDGNSNDRYDSDPLDDGTSGE